ncbi:MAG: OmpH family outer membrane protein [Candidatus Sericytochromatia bacterium]|nr:OmpH family outer membrane protein [Candidatus Sericytochromatia bacterium]
MLRQALLAVATLSVLAPAASAAPAIGVVDFQALQKAPVAQKAMAKLNAAQGSYQKELQIRSQKLDEAQKRKASADELSKLRQQFEKELQTLRTKGEQDAQSATETLQRDLERAVKTVADQKKLEMVFRKEAMLYGGADITLDVEKQLNKTEESSK